MNASYNKNVENSLYSLRIETETKRVKYGYFVYITKFTMF